VSVAERGHDPGWVLLRVYDDHKPTAWSYVLLEEPLSVRPGVCFSMIWRGDCLEHRPEMGFKLDMAAVRIKHMPQPRVLEKHHLYSLGRCRFGEDGSSCLWAVCQGRWLSRSFAGVGSAQPGYLPDRTRDSWGKLGRRSCSRPPVHEIARFSCDTSLRMGGELPERLFTMAYGRPGFAEPLASARHGRSKPVAKAPKTASASQL
jgi:hypothetical protein